MYFECMMLVSRLQRQPEPEKKILDKRGVTPLNSISTKTEITRTVLASGFPASFFIYNCPKTRLMKRERLKERRVGIKAPPIYQFPPG